MIESHHRSPAQVSAQAAAAMPRWVLLLLLSGFIVPGLFGHALWPSDAVGFGRIWSVVHGGAQDWALPNVAGAPAAQGGPLPAWVGALFVLVFGPLLGELRAAALANIAWFALAAYALWLGVYRLARRDQAQPVAAAFGGEANRSDYARLLADVAVLLLIGTLGLVWRLHQIQSDCTSLAIGAVAVLASSLIEWSLLPAAMIAGGAAGALALTVGAPPAAGLLLGSALVFGSAAEESGNGAARIVLAIALMAASALGVAAAWPLAAQLAGPNAAAGAVESLRGGLALPGKEEALWLLRNGAWFLWPLWPLAAWALYAWRTSLATPHLLRPLLLCIALAAASACTRGLAEHLLVAWVPPLAALAAFGATTLRRALDNFVDWLAMALFSLGLLFLWAYFVAMQAGLPRAMAASIAHLAPGYAPALEPLAVLLAVGAAIAWGRLIAWRLLRRPQVLWRGPMLAAAGVCLGWVSANLLYLPAADYIFSSRPVAEQIAGEMQALGAGTACVEAHRIPLAERAMLAYYGKIHFVREAAVGDCPFALQYESRRSIPEDDPPPGPRGTWELRWETRRAARPLDRWRIWARVQ